MTNNSKTKLEKITRTTLKTLMWSVLPGLGAAIEYSISDLADNHRRNSDGDLPGEIPIFVIATVLGAGVVFGINEGYNALTKKEYGTKNITIEVKHNDAMNDSFWNYASYASPLVRLAKVGFANDITSIKTDNLEVEIENSKLITFDETRGFTLNKESYYNKTSFGVKATIKPKIKVNTNTGYSYVTEDQPEEEGVCRVGTRVRHATYGEGIIRVVEGKGEKAKVTVHFRSCGVKKLILGYANLVSY